MLFTEDGRLMHSLFVSGTPPETENKKWWTAFVNALGGIKEADIVYEHRRIYIRKSQVGYLIVLMDIYAPIAMVRLNCDIILPQLKKKKGSRGFMRFFKR